MCGIIGWLGNNIDEALAFKLRDRMYHRGPNDCGSYLSENKDIWFGHRRLSILDLSKFGNQPMLSKSGRYLFTYNGEIYNYLEIRKQLESEDP